MYISGTAYDLEARIHQLVRNSGELQQYINESLLYTGVTFALKERWDKEIEKKQTTYLWFD